MILKKSYNFLLTIILFEICAVQCERSSLTFVIDTTLSMIDDIRETIDASREILNIAVNANSSRIENFVLVTFNDPDVQTVIATKSPEDFEAALTNLEVYGGGDCPEMSMAGIEQALDVSLPDSFIYVFTDASAKDYWRADRVKSLCQQKQSRVIFVLTGKCETGGNARDYQVYHEVAAVSSGQVFHLMKSEVSKILESVPSLINGKTSVLTSKHLPPGCNTAYFNVDDRTGDVTISASGEEVTLFPIDTTSVVPISQQNVVDTRDVKIATLLKPQPGSYWVTACSSIGATLVVTGKTELEFQHGFSEVIPKSIEDTVRQPIAGHNCYLSIALTDPGRNVGLKLVEILDIEEIILFELPVVEFYDNLFITELFTPPTVLFKIAIKGFDKSSGQDIRRISKTAIQPEKPVIEPVNKRPAVAIEEGDHLEVVQDNQVTLTCNVSAHPPPDIIWEDGDGNKLNGTFSPAEPPYGYISYLIINEIKNATNYTCKASNILATNYKTTEVTLEDKFEVIDIPSNKSIEYGTDGELHCRVNAVPAVTTQWYFKGEPVLEDEYNKLSSDNTTLKLLNINAQAIGDYKCEVSNGIESRAYEARVSIPGLVPPKLDKTVTEKHAKPGSPLTIRCPVVEGNPEPQIFWYYKSKDSPDFVMIREVDSTLTVLATAGDDGAIYRCNADNEVGHDYHDFQIKINKLPEFIRRRRGRKPKLEVKEGEKVTLPCQVKGDAKFKWTKNGIPITENKFKIDKNNTLSFIAAAKDSDLYICAATNDFGTSRIKFKLSVLGGQMKT